MCCRWHPVRRLQHGMKLLCISPANCRQVPVFIDEGLRRWCSTGEGDEAVQSPTLNSLLHRKSGPGNSLPPGATVSAKRLPERGNSLRRNGKTAVKGIFSLHPGKYRVTARRDPFAPDCVAHHPVTKTWVLRDRLGILRKSPALPRHSLARPQEAWTETPKFPAVLCQFAAASQLPEKLSTDGVTLEQAKRAKRRASKISDVDRLSRNRACAAALTRQSAAQPRGAAIER